MLTVFRHIIDDKVNEYSKNGVADLDKMYKALPEYDVLSQYSIIESVFNQSKHFSNVSPDWIVRKSGLLVLVGRVYDAIELTHDYLLCKDKLEVRVLARWLHMLLRLKSGFCVYTIINEQFELQLRNILANDKNISSLLKRILLMNYDVETYEKYFTDTIFRDKHIVDEVDGILSDKYDYEKHIDLIKDCILKNKYKQADCMICRSFLYGNRICSLFKLVEYAQIDTNSAELVETFTSLAHWYISNLFKDNTRYPIDGKTFLSLIKLTKHFYPDVDKVIECCDYYQ